MYQILLSLIIICTLVGILFIALLVVVSRVQQRRNKDLHKLNILTEISLQEKERAHLSNELHEEFAPSFSYLKLNISHLKNPLADPSTLSASTDHLDGLMKRVRQLSFELLPPGFKHLGLVVTLERMIDQVSACTSLEIRLDIDENLPVLKDHSAIHSYRILQEIVQNTVKHANARLLTLTLKVDTGQLRILGGDDGSGFDYQQVLKSSSGFGFKSMVNRTRALGGNIEVLSRKGKGTAYMIELPL